MTEGGADRLDAWLRHLDPTAGREIDRRNRRRVLRALEVTLLTGRPFSDVGRQRDPPLHAIFIGLHTERTRLYARIRDRLQQMVRAGWLEELRMLLAMGYSERLPALTATGYSELAGVLRGERTLAEALQLVEYATHAFVRRQETWLRHDTRIHWVDADAPGLCQRALEVIDANSAVQGLA
jgi:tRNA dimethylallyltransferase